MPVLTWDENSKRTYEIGVDHCVLYVKDNKSTAHGGYAEGVAWSGITNVTQSPSGAEANPLYADNIKYLNLFSAEEFGATIEAYTYPDEFMQCNGEANATYTPTGGVPTPLVGVTFGQQERIPFGLVYRTKIGNADTDSLGYKYHIVYNAKVSPSEVAYPTVNDSPEAVNLSWEITTTSETPANTTIKPTAYVCIDTTKFPPDESTGARNAQLVALETALFGGAEETAKPYLPTIDEIIAMITPSSVTIKKAYTPVQNSTNPSTSTNK